MQVYFIRLGMIQKDVKLLRTIGRRSIVLYILLGAFAAGTIWLVISLFINGGTWAMQPYNGHLSAAAMGEITDRDGVTLAKTVDGVRQYNDDETVRKALLHTIGDTGGFINTSVQATMASRLSGYNVITGVNNTVFNSLGGNIKLTVSAQVSRAAYNALGDKNGAVMVYNYKTGEIITKVSKPAYDPANKPDNIEDNPAYEGVYLDRNLSSSFTPGSIFKLVTQAAAMEKWPNDWRNRQYTCNGSVTINGSAITCLGTHGTVDAAGALGNSCNVYYALLANDVGAGTLQAKAEQMGFNKTINFDSVVCRESTISLSGANDNELAWAGVGQYTLLANPYHMLVLMGSIAQGGTYTEPKLTNSANLLASLSAGERNLMSSTEAANLKTLMRSNVQQYYGDYLFPDGMQVCAKSGTAEVGEGKNPTCWFVGFCDSDTYPYAFVVMVEEGIGGIESAGNAASTIMNAVASYV